ncbi:EAL domain-containing protein [Rhodococcus sp. X156]|uniref:EAL domain-containing protein n=1 Tax=Rhodococcus sp. X156 TaxID=2499145 RepID=UPI000FDC5813|nr:EAL domain-containing protein [Rhodococcus sp. X156]
MSEVPETSDGRWRAALQDVVERRTPLALHAQPIVELTTGRVAGYELLSRFTGPWQASPDRWFAAADHWGFNAELQSRVLSAGIAARAHLPANTFLTVNVDPHLLTVGQVADVLTGTDDLTRVVLELTEHTQGSEHPTAAAVIEHVRSVGGLIAMDDAGTGYAGLSKLLTLRPDIVKLDRELVTGIDRDPVKRSLVEVFGDLAGRMDAWILAEGIETTGELDALIALGVPLGQGWALARPAPTMRTELEPDTVTRIRSTASRTVLGDHVASLVRTAVVGSDPLTCDVLVAETGRVTQVRVPGAVRGSTSGWAPAMTVAPSADVVEVARRAVVRAEPHRFAPLVCTDGAGSVLGTVTVDDLVVALCRRP